MMSRRNTLLGLGAVTAAFAGIRSVFGGATAQAAQPSALPPVYEVAHTDEEWQKLLPPDAYRVLRHAGTEAPYSSALNKEKRAGAFTCAGCALPLFASSTKFESGTGWPSFWKPLDGAVAEETDSTLFMKRTEILCHRCGGHLGHVFDDGPKPTGLRYCMNGVALNFKAASA